MITFRCAHCGLLLQVDDRSGGKPARCPACKHVSAVPSPAATVTWKAPEELDGVHSTLARAGLKGDVNLDSPDPGGTPRPSRAARLQKGQAQGQRYVLEGEIARGGMGAVLRALDCDIRREVAVKYLLDQADAAKKLRFIEEAQITGQLEHPNIVPIHELGIDSQKRLFFSMKMVKGRSLAQVLDLLRKDPAAAREYTLGRLLTILVNVCHALAYAHARGVVHRDLKPANIMLGDFGEVYVMDWGLAKLVGQGAAASAPVAVPAVPAIGSPPPPQAIPVSASVSVSGSQTERVVTSRSGGEAELTQEGSVLGTPVYMPPEQACGQVADVDQRSDVYSLGAILYEMLSLHPPVDRGGGMQAILQKVAEGKVPLPEERARKAGGRWVPKELSAVAMKALAKEKGDRYPSVSPLRQDLERYLEGRSVSAKEDTTREMLWKFVKRNKGFSVGTAAALAVLLVVVWLFTAANYRARLRAEEANAAMVEEQRDKRERGKKSAPLFLASAQRSEEGKDLDYALAQVEVALEYDPELAAARLLRAQLLLGRKDVAGAREELGRYLEAKPDDADARRLFELCKGGDAEGPSTVAAIVDVLARQKMFGLAEHLTRSKEKAFAISRQRIEAAWPGLGNRLTLDGDGRLILNFLDCGNQVSDLTPLTGMRLNSFALSGSVPVVDLAPLRGMPLASLRLSSSRIRDWQPLRGMPLTSLYLSHCQPSLTDLELLRGMPLTSLELPQTCGQIRDLSPLQEMKLTRLDLTHDVQLRDLSPLRGMPLISLDLGDTRITDLAPLAGMKLTWLHLSNCPEVTDLTPLRGAPLTQLSIESCSKVKDLSPLRGMKLSVLYLANSGVTDLTPLHDMELVSLSFSPKTVTGEVDGIRRLKSLNSIGLTGRSLLPAEQFWKRYDAGEYNK
jgi:serine/threonine protein kinase/phage FluMu protein Com